MIEERDTSLILIVDDDQTNRQTMKSILVNQDYNFVFAADGLEALNLAATMFPDLILLDVVMPVMNGYEVCKRIRNNPRLAEVPILMITALDDEFSRLQGLEAGADDFISKPIGYAELRARVRTITKLNRYRRLLSERAKFERVIELAPIGIIIVDVISTIHLANPAMVQMLKCKNKAEVKGSSLFTFISSEQFEFFNNCLDKIINRVVSVLQGEMMFINSHGEPFLAEIDLSFFVWDNKPSVQIMVRDITERKRAESEIQQANADLALAYHATLEGWSRALELRDQNTEGHSQRVTQMTIRLAEAMGIEKSEQMHIYRGAILHDIGKMGIPDSILNKPGPLTEEERAIMRNHPIYAYQMLLPIAYLGPALDIPHYHHEKWDGTGYPEGLKGEQIPLPARIFAVADVWDALTSDRPYRLRWPKEEVCTYIGKQSGSHFDPKIVELFLKIIVYTD